ncbi:MAG: MBOAT family protein [Candidatus Gastranaerophilales bacterium]|nr:MBOAT family protein [Candidatus Gastranaerophilales bacterium]
MNFNSLSFLLFFPIVFVLHFAIPQKYRWIVLLVASYYFYMSWNPMLVFLILFTTIVSYTAGLLIEKYTDNKKIKLVCLIVTLTICLGILFAFKYLNFLVSSSINLFRFCGLNIDDFYLNLLLPIGISFYTFQTLSYVIDIYRGSIKAERHFGYYALFVSFFPQLVAGPIERPENLIPQLKVEKNINSEDMIVGVRSILVGFFKKVVIADSIATYVNVVYNNPTYANGLMVFFATLLFAIQIYCDFSGYTDIAIGVARTMGIKLMQNFNRPYIATSIKDFWSRWHISLSSWFKDYLYIPLGGNRCSKHRYFFNILIVFLVSGLWHGANWTFIIWGALHGVYQIIETILKKPMKHLGDKIHITSKNQGILLLKRIGTFLLVSFAWIFFRANSVADCGILLTKLFSDYQFSISFITSSFSAMGLDCLSIIFVLLSMVAMSMLSNVIHFQPQIYKDLTLNKSESIIRKMSYIYFILIIIFAWILLLSSNEMSSFIYFQF